MPGLVTLGGRQALLARDDADTTEITEQQTSCLAEMIRRPMDYNQRFVEQLSFVPTGGLRWERNLQIQLPTGAGSAERWWILPLGPFNRRRFPDINAINAAGEPLNLLTRKAHGSALSKATFAKQIVALPAAAREALGEPDAKERLKGLYEKLSRYFTETTKQPVNISSLSTDPSSASEAVGAHPRVANARAILRDYKQLLDKVGTSKDDLDTNLASLTDVLEQAIDTTHYLCWARGKPGEVINVRVSHTIADPRRTLKRKTIRSALRAMWTGFFWTKKQKRREEAADWYRRFGLAPINYEFNIPTFCYAASYYSTLAPPAKTNLTYLDWGKLGNSYEEKEREYSEVNSSSPSVHIYNADPGEAEDADRSSLRAYLRCTPHHHKQILGAALLNAVFVWLLAEGRLPGRPGDPLQGVLLAAPSVLIAFLAQQQRHYYEHALRPSRGILWGYLMVGGLFLVAVAFSGQDVSAGGPGLGTRASAAAWLLAISSVAIFVWHFPLGHMYERIVGLLFEREMKKGEAKGSVQSWKCYEAAYERCSRWIWRLVVLSALATLLFLILAWDQHSSAAKKKSNGDSVLVHIEPQARQGRSR